MAILRNSTQKNYTVVSNEILRDQDLKLFDRGMLITILALPDGWNLTIRGLNSMLPDGRDNIQNSINRLVKMGYLKRIQEHDDSGKFGNNIIEVCVPKQPPEVEPEIEKTTSEKIEKPNPEQTNGVNKPFLPCPEIPYTVKPDTVDTDTDKSNTYISNTNKYNYSSSLQKNPNKSEPSEWMMTKRIDVDALTRSFDTDTVNDVCGVIDLIYSDSSKNVYSVNSSKTAKADIRKLFEEKLNQEQLQEVLERLKDSKPTKIVAKDSYYLTILFNQLQNFRTTTGPPRHLAGAHNFQERTDTDWDALELKLLMKDNKP